MFDIETFTSDARPEGFAICCLYGQNTKMVFHTIQEFKDYIFSGEFDKKYLFCHFAEFDLNGIFGNIFTDLDRSAIFNGSTFIMAQKEGVIFADSLNIYKTSVEKLGKLFGFPKLTMNSKFGSGKRFKVSQKDIDYCMRDCEIVWHGLDKIFTMVHSVRPTLASLSMIYFRRFYQKFDFAYNKTSIDFFQSYFGGRVEAYKLGVTKSYKYDINSMYPYIGSIAKFPNPKFIKVSRSYDLTGLLHDMKFYEGQATIKVKHKKTYFGFLPVKKDGKLIFPVGVFSGTWCFPEIRFALENNIIEILDVQKVWISYPMDTPFKEFYTDLYNKRLNSKDEIDKTLIKLIMNSNYGKWGQREKHKDTYYNKIPVDFIELLERDKIPYKLKLFNSVREDCYLTIYNPNEAIKIDKGYRLKYTDFDREIIITNYKVYTKKELDNLTISPKIHTIPAFSSYITSLARVHLLKQMLKYEKYGVTYCDTDCICLEKTPDIKDSLKLGDFKKENEVLTNIFGNKNYMQIDNENNISRKIKGVPKKSIRILESSEKYIYLSKQREKLSNHEIFEFQNMTKTKTAIRHNKKAGVWNLVTKFISNNYDKRSVNSDGSTSPINLEK